MNFERINQAIKETKKFIETEEKNSPEFRPANIQRLLAYYKIHLVHLHKMLDEISCEGEIN